jgi:lipopolysaccharide export system protein LptA
MLLTPLSCFALSSDREQSILIEADQVDIDDKNGVSSYSGNVQLMQGSIVLKADNILVHTENRTLVRVVASGRPAIFKQTPDGEDTDVEALAHRIEYHALDGKLYLSREATLQQGPNHFTGNQIEYDTQQNFVSAKSDKTSNSRVQVVIQPQSLKE